MSRNHVLMAIIGLSMIFTTTNVIANIVVDVGDGGMTTWAQAISANDIQPTAELSWASK
jgi:hypothetical protein